MHFPARVTIVAYAIFCFNGIFNLLPGVLVIEIAKSFRVDTHVIGYLYSLFVVGNVLAVQINGRILERLNIQKELFAAMGLILTGVLGITTCKWLPLFALFILLCGIGGGLFNSIGNYLIVNLYEAKERSSKLNLLHFTFSVGAIVSPLFSGSLLNGGIPWQYIYRYTLVLLLFLAILVFGTPIQVKKRTGTENKMGKEVWNPAVYAIALGLFCYMIAEQSFVFWGNTYFIEGLSFSMTQASLLVSLFWLCMAVGRGSSGVIIKYVPVERYILVCSCFGFISFIGLLCSNTFGGVVASVSFMGLSFSGLYASILSYGTLQLKFPSAKLVSLYITFGCLGGVLSTPFSSFVKAYLGLRPSLMISAVFMALVFLLVTSVRLGWFKRKERNQP